MRTTLFVGISFLAGTVFGSVVASRAAIKAIREAPIERVAERAVKDMEAAYRQEFDKRNVFDLFEKKYNECLSENAQLKHRTYRLESVCAKLLKGIHTQ